MIEYRSLKHDDIPTVVYLEETLLNETIGEKMLGNELYNKYAHFYVACDENKVIGYIGCWIIEGTCEIINFLVSKEYQHQGIGQKLFTIIENLAIDKGAFEVLLEVKATNQNAQKFYFKQGFEIISQRKAYYHDKSDALVMRKGIL